MARRRWSESLDIYQLLESPRSEPVRQLLAALDDTMPGTLVSSSGSETAGVR